MSKILLIAADHGGYELKAVLKTHAEEAGWQVIDFGTDTSDRVNYPVFAQKLCKAVLAGEGQFGVLICGSGIGMSMAANRFKGIRAAVCHDVTTARLAREHNDANILCLGGRTTGAETAKNCLRTFLETEFEGERHKQRVDLLG